MDVNKYKLLLSTVDQDVVIPIQMNWDFLDRSDSLIDFETKAIRDSINQNKDYEVSRFSHAGVFDYNTNTLKTDINYSFNFVPSGASVYTTTWLPSYVAQGFSTSEIYYYSNSFKKSFFKLDLYDTTDLNTQKNYVTIIIPTEQGLTTGATVGFQTQNIKTPNIKLDFLGYREGFFIYWMKNRSVLDIETFYMTAKFFDAKQGVFIKMMNRPQSTISGNKFNFPQEQYFYYKVALNYNDYTYNVYDISGGTDVLVGGENNQILWYEYINP